MCLHPEEVRAIEHAVKVPPPFHSPLPASRLHGNGVWYLGELLVRNERGEEPGGGWLVVEQIPAPEGWMALCTVHQGAIMSWLL